MGTLCTQYRKSRKFFCSVIQGLSKNAYECTQIIRASLFFLTEHTWRKVMQTRVELGYNTKGAEYFVLL